MQGQIVDPETRAESVLDVLNLVLADVRYGLGPYTAIYLLTEHGWNESGIALAFSFGSIVGLVIQGPIGALIDAVRMKRALLATSVAVVTVTSFLIIFAPRFWPVAAAGVVGAFAGSIIETAMAAISLGIVGRIRFARRAARNEALFHGGNVVINLTILAAAPYLGLRIVFWMLALAGAASAATVLAIPRDAIDHAQARGLSHHAVVHPNRPPPWRALLMSRTLLIFAGCGALFHLANGSMLGLVVQRAARTDPASCISVAAACMIAAQIAMVATAMLAGAKADVWGRKPIFLAAFLALAMRGALYTLSANPAWTIFVQLLDGVGVGVFGALFTVVIADLTDGSGHFNAAKGLVGTIQSVGGILSAPLGSLIVVGVSYEAAFLTQAAIAAAGALLFAVAMPETRDAALMADRGREAIALAE
jgi:MFS family permease